MTDADMSATDALGPEGGPQRQAAGAPADPLVACLAFLSKHYGNPRPAEALVAGLPLGDDGLGWQAFERAADRAALLVEPAKRSLARFRDVELPAILRLKDGRCLVMMGRRRAGNRRSTLWIETVEPTAEAEAREHTAEDLSRLYAGEAILVRPDTSAEDPVEGVSGKSTSNWFWSAFTPCAWIYRQVVLATVIINLFALALPLFFRNVYDRVIPNHAVETLWALGLGVVVAAVLDFVLRGVRAYFIDIASRQSDVTLANRIFSRVLGARLAFRGASSGARANVLREYETLRDFFNSLTLATFGDMPFIVLFIAAIWLVGGELAIVPAITVPAVAVIVLLAQVPLNRLVARSFAAAAAKNGVLFETLNGLETVKSLGAESWAADAWERSVAESIRTSVKMRLISSISLNVVVTAQMLSAVALMVLGVNAIAAGDISAGSLFAAVILNSRAIAPLGQVARVLSLMYRARLAYKALQGLVAAPQERPNRARFVNHPKIAGAVRFKNVTFTYPGEKQPALKEVSFSVAPGERVAFVGPIGSGKSTLLRLVLNLYSPDSGAVLVDNLDVVNMDPALLRVGVGYMPQDIQLFRGTLRSNICLHDRYASDDAVIKAARRSGALDWINQRAAGFDTPVGERGDGLSGGQRQSVALARALLRDPPVMLLDEPTSDMDALSEQAFVRQMKGEAAGKTLLLVTHRPALLELVDRVVVLDGGSVQMDGPKHQVMKTLRSSGGKGQPEPSRMRASVTPVPGREARSARASDGD